MRTGSGTGTTGLNWLFGDHLGSTSRSANYDGASTALQLYKAWGESRYASGTLPTGFKFTGQRLDGLCNAGLIIQPVEAIPIDER